MYHHVFFSNYPIEKTQLYKWKTWTVSQQYATTCVYLCVWL